MNATPVFWVAAASLMLTLCATPSQAQQPDTNDKSGRNGNTGGGSGALAGTDRVDTRSTGYGFEALQMNSGANANSAFGFKAMQRNGFRGCSGSLGAGMSCTLNTAAGAFSLFENSGGANTAMGFGALVRNTGDSNTAVGILALGSGVPLTSPTGFPEPSGEPPNLGNVMSGHFNSALGASALANNVTGSFNTAMGRGAVGANVSGNANTGIGDLALSSNTTGGRNTALGWAALSDNLNGSANIAIGELAGTGMQQGHDNIYLGNNVRAGQIGEIRVMRLGNAQGNTSVRRTFIAGIANPADFAADAIVMINLATGQLGVRQSSARYKRDIESTGTSSRGLFALRPVTFRYNEDARGEQQYGLIAEEVAAVYPELVGIGATGEIETVRYQELVPMLLNELQRQQQHYEELRASVTALKQQVERLTSVRRQADEVTISMSFSEESAGR